MDNITKDKIDLVMTNPDLLASKIYPTIFEDYTYLRKEKETMDRIAVEKASTFSTDYANPLDIAEKDFRHAAKVFSSAFDQLQACQISLSVDSILEKAREHITDMDAIAEGLRITVTDEGFRYVGKALRRGSAKNERVDEFVEYSKIVEFKKTMGVYNITGNGYTYTIAVDKSDKEAIEYIHQRFMQEQNKPHIMKCNICGQIYTYTFAEMDEQLKKMKTAAGSMVGATLTSLASSRLVGSVQSGNAQAQVNSAADKLDALSRCPNCRSTDATEITAEEAAKIRAASTVPVQAASNADELKKFKELLDSGIITQEEFDAKKKHLLGL